MIFTIFQMPHVVPMNGIGFGPGIPCLEKKSKFDVPLLEIKNEIKITQTKNRIEFDWSNL